MTDMSGPRAFAHKMPIRSSSFAIKLSLGLICVVCGLCISGAALALGWIDSDLDGVPDSKDACPHSRPNAVVDAKGCEIRRGEIACIAPEGELLSFCEPAAQKAQYGQARQNKQDEQVKRSIGESNVVRVYFAFASAEVSIDQWPQLAKVRDFLSASDARLTLVGHTDNIGSEAVNLSLSRQRAERVKQIFVQDYGVKAERLSIVAKGASQPVTDNFGPGERALNRRVEFIVEAR
ncbi:OmpA family protein [Shewanella loihica]|uniref:OmpA/MotB domain protein n=1 Tax=Shewanella loihica (strain ATCC BAA-1088 / PV-4) TaxID=323850 RepID=A3QC24_SHELP|nr:OmpA family protein [Shewanella loihica]ABO23022.1 OmpA/MotB domain protein [Shewanella loihica PV-4]